MTIRRIMGTSGGFLPTDRWTAMVPGKTVLKMLELTGKDRPRICFVHTASGDDASYLTRSYSAMSNQNCDVSHLQLFTQPNAPVREHLLKSDVIWVGGGSVANLLAVWRLHGVDQVMQEAYESGVILGGVSAGSICWHQSWNSKGINCYWWRDYFRRNSFGSNLRSAWSVAIGFLSSVGFCSGIWCAA